MNPIFYGLTVLTVGAVILQGLRKVKASDPPQVGIKTFLGKITGNIAKPGWHFFLFYPYLQGFIPESVQTRDLNLSKEKIRTPDQAECQLSGKISWKFDEEHPREFINSGGDKGVAQKLENIWQGVIREWAISAVGGPQTYMEFLSASEEAVDLLLKSIVRDSVNKIPTDIPTSVLLKYFKKPFSGKPTESEKKKWGATWQKLEKVIRQEIADNNYNYNSIKELEEAVKKRQEAIKAVRQGRGEFKKKEWGIIIQLLNLTELEPLGELAKAMELEAKELREEAADKREIENFRKRSKDLQGDNERTVEQADEIVFVERGKAKKEIKKLEVSLSPETKPFLEGLLKLLK